MILRLMMKGNDRKSEERMLPLQPQMAGCRRVIGDPEVTHCLRQKSLDDPVIGGRAWLPLMRDLSRNHLLAFAIFFIALFAILFAVVVQVHNHNMQRHATAHYAPATQAAPTN
jgi:hypothetical protein